MFEFLLKVNKIDCCALNKVIQIFSWGLTSKLVDDKMWGTKNNVRNVLFSAQEATKTLTQCTKKQSNWDGNPASGYPDTQTSYTRQYSH